MNTNGTKLSIKNRIADILLYFLFWLVYFQILRLFFAFYHYKKFIGIPISESFQVFLFSFRPDISAICYIFVIIFFLLIFNEFIRSTLISKLITIYSYIWIAIIAIISVADAQLYNEWGTKINRESLSFFMTPNEFFASIISSPIIPLTIAIIAFIFIGYILYHKFFKLTHKFSPSITSERLYSRIFKLSIFYITLLIVLIIGVRGGTQLAPMNPSFAYFSKHDILNNTTINPTWNLGYNILEKPNNRDYYIHFSRSEVDSLLQHYKLQADEDTSSIFVLNGKPNIVLVIVESFTADVIESLGGLTGVTPNFDYLIQNGLSFQNFYASGNRTYKSLPAILNGYPSLPADRVIKYNYVYSKFPSIAKTLNGHGYFSSFYYGGETEFANIRSLVLESDFDTIIDQRDFDDVEKNSKWGAHDHVVYNRVLRDIESYPKPFLTTILTLSNHEPFEIPSNPVFKNGGDPKTLLFKNTAAYTDQSIGNFIKEASQKEWFNNTIFIFTADHGHHYAKHRTNKKFPEMFHIPLVIYSSLLKDSQRGTKITEYSSQSDIPALLFSQIKYDYIDFIWSKNVFNPNQIGSAYYGFVDGFGWLTSENTIVYDNLSEQIIFSSGEQSRIDESLKTGQAYLQSLYQNFLSY
jgi:phosphoglycerol transferase MdoB-like AlkP superfamily enzyme